MDIKQMKILGRKWSELPSSVPFSILSEEWAQNIHRQSLDRLNERGGMCPLEIYLNIEKLGIGIGVQDSLIISSINESINKTYQNPELIENNN
tara:strand:- start:882 stop:1160 length:279 start_codon:yes stop_codon:yes gene_type:complete